SKKSFEKTECRREFVVIMELRSPARHRAGSVDCRSGGCTWESVRSGSGQAARKRTDSTSGCMKLSSRRQPHPLQPICESSRRLSQSLNGNTTTNGPMKPWDTTHRHRYTVLLRGSIRRDCRKSSIPKAPSCGTSLIAEI